MTHLFKAGGAINPNSPIYIQRTAEQKALYEILRGEYVHVFAPRQAGKTSALRKIELDVKNHGWKTCYLDLSLWMDFSKNVWYSALGSALSKSLTPSRSIKLTNQIDLRDYLISEAIGKTNGCIAIFFDEVEAVAKAKDKNGLPFSDTFFMTLRNLYIQKEDYEGTIVCVFSGSTNPDHLVQDMDISPFNIGTEVTLDNFTNEQSRQLTINLATLSFESVPEEIHNRIFEWTAGHPYLVQKICLELENLLYAGKLRIPTQKAVDKVVEDNLLQLSNPAICDKNIRHVIKLVKSLSTPGKAILEKLIAGQKVYREQVSHDVSVELYLTGAVKCVGDEILIRNKIYAIALQQISNNHDRYNPLVNITILHLSDIHLGTSQDALKYRIQLEIDLRKNLGVEHLDYLIISGDIANRSTPGEYTAALELVQGIVDHFALSSTRLICVPGNHDLNWDFSETSYTFVPKRKAESKWDDGLTIQAGDAGVLVRDETLYKKRFAIFNENFYQKLFGMPYPTEYGDQAMVHYYPEHEILFLALNSAWQIDHYYRNRSGINMQALGIALEQITDKKFDNWLKIAIWHHPVYGAEMMNDEFMELLAVQGFQLCMHGHVHEALEGLYKYDNARGIYILGTGTFGAPAKDQVAGIPLQYNLLVLDRASNILTVETRKKEKPDGSWSADARWGDKNNPVPRYQVRLKPNVEK